MTQKEIVVLEDQEDTRLLIDRILTTGGYTVHHARSTKEALQICETRLPHAVLVDIQLENESGFDYIQYHQNHPLLQNIPFIIVTGFSERTLFLNAMSRGASEYILKPLNATVVLRKLKRVLRASRPARSVTLLDNEKYKVKLSTKGTLVAASEFGVLVEAPIRLSKGSAATLSAPLLRELDHESTLAVKSPSPVTIPSQGRYLNELLMVGLNEPFLVRLRNRIKDWL